MQKQQTNNQQPINGEMDEDDRPVGRVLSRRAVLALLGGGSAILLGAMHALAAETVYI
jgi:hypothetical protein